MPSSAKSCANYANSFLAKKKAINEGYDEAILLNQAGFISEGPGENIFIIKHGQLFTPTLADDILKGITRDTVITIANDMGIETIEKQLTIEDLLTSDECFFTGTAAEVTPIREINNQTIGNGGKGHLTSTIQSAYFNIVKGKDNNYASWLTMCND